MTEAEQKSRQEGKDAFHQKIPFNQCPYDGMKPEDIHLRWHWQKGWLAEDWELHEAAQPKKA